MYANSVLAVTGALLSAVAAVPMVAEPHHRHHHAAHKREIVWETAIDEVIVTVPVTKTVWIEPGETPPTYSPQESSVAPVAYTPPASSSAPAAPAYTPPSSSSAPAAPAYTPPSSSSAPAAPAYTPPASSSAPAAPAYTPPTSSSAPAAPAYTPPTTTSTYVAPTYAAPTTSSAPAPASSSSSSGSSDGLSGMAAPGTYYTGDMTWYDVGMGACGETSVPSDHIVAIPEAIFDAYNPGNPNNNPLCGKYVSITGVNGSVYKAKIVDRCPGCTKDDLDLSQDFFNMVTNNGDGRVHGIKWCFD